MEFSSGLQIVLSFFTFLFFSIAINIILGVMLKQTTTQLQFFAQGLSELVLALKRYRDHLKGISELEQFYGDESIKNLLEHSHSLNKYLEKYEELYSLILNEQDLDENLFEVNAEEEEPDIKEIIPSAR